MKPLTTLAKGLLPLVNAIVSTLDEEAWRFLAPHQDKLVCFEIIDVATLYFQIKREGLELIHYEEGMSIHTTFRGTFASLTSMVFSKKAVHKDLHIRGDLECAKALYDTWQYLECDWEGAVSKWTHPTLAHGLFTGLRRGKDWVKETSQHRAEDLTAFLQDEIRLLPTPEEINQLLEAIEKCREDVERLEAKIALLSKERSR